MTMHRALILFMVLLLTATASGIPVYASEETTSATPGVCQEGVLPSGSLWLICIPSEGWNNDLVVYAHGYIAFNEPVAIQHLSLPDGTYLPDLVQNLGYAFATTSYRQNGLTVLEGADDIRELVTQFPLAEGASQPTNTYLTGVSQGGLITTLLMEQSPELFSGGLAACGPIGNFRAQMNYIGDFRVLFDYFFPGILPGTAIQIPSEVIDNWETTYVPAVTAALTNNPDLARELIRVSGAAVNPLVPATIIQTTINVLWYNVFATNDAIEKLGGNPYNNIGRWYRGSTDDLALNQGVQRFTLDLAALPELARYQTSGQMTKPLVTLHTLGDEIIPIWHQRVYRSNVQLAGDGQLTPITRVRYGHCNFTAGDILVSFQTLITQVEEDTGSGP